MTRSATTDGNRTDRQAAARGERNDPAAPGPTAAHVHQVRIADLRVADSPRIAGLDADHVRALAHTEARLPPILVQLPTMLVVDGRHRVAAARLNGRPEIEARFVRCAPEDVFRLSVEANIANGLPLGLADRRAAAVRLLRSHPALSDRSIARSAGLAAATVAAIRDRIRDTDAGPDGLDGRDAPAASDELPRIGADGRIRPRLATEGRLAAGRIIAARPDATLREIAGEAGISVATAQDVRNRLLRGLEPVPTGRPAPPAAQSRADDPQYQPTSSTDFADLLGVLRRDPTLRYSDTGRDLVRWLDQRVITLEQCQEKAEVVPPHCAERVLEIARRCASTWTALADAIDAAARGGAGAV